MVFQTWGLVSPDHFPGIVRRAQSNSLVTVNPDSTLRKSIQSDILLHAASTTIPGLQATTSTETVGQSAALGLSATTSSQTVAAASSQALVGGSNSTNDGSEVGILAQIIIAIGVIPVELLIITAVLGIHMLMHRKPSRPSQSRAVRTKSRRDSLPYLQPKAELEDEQRRRYELHSERIARELDGEDRIFQMPDETGRLCLPSQGRHGRYEMPADNHVSWETSLRGMPELMGDEHAQELEGPIHEDGGRIRVDNAQELDSPLHDSDYVRVEDASGLATAFAHPVTDSTLVEKKPKAIHLETSSRCEISILRRQEINTRTTKHNLTFS